MNAVVEHIPAAQTTAVAPIQKQEDGLLLLIERALSNPDIQTDKLNALLDMRIKWDAEQRRNAKEDAAEQARKEFNAAMAEFKKLVPAILKDKHVEFDTQRGVTSYDHATIGAVCDAVIPALASAGISHSWEPQQEPNKITVTCTLDHVGGHKKSTSLYAAPDTSGTKNAIQSVSSTITYLERYTLLLVCGVATKGMPDDDGRASGNAPTEITKLPDGVIPPEGYDQWAANLRAVCDEGREKLLKTWKDSLMERRAFMTKYEPRRWDSMKKLAEGVSKQLASEGVES